MTDEFEPWDWCCRGCYWCATCACTFGWGGIHVASLVIGIAVLAGSPASEETRLSQWLITHTIVSIFLTIALPTIIVQYCSDDDHPDSNWRQSLCFVCGPFVSLAVLFELASLIGGMGLVIAELLREEGGEEAPGSLGSTELITVCIVQIASLPLGLCILCNICYRVNKNILA